MADSATPNVEILAQYDVLTSAVGVVDWSARSLFELTGKDRASFLHNFCTHDIKKLATGDSVEAFVTSVQGKTFGHVFVFAEAARLLVSCPAGEAAKQIAHLDRYLISEDVAFRELTGEYGQLLAIGPQVSEGIPGHVATWFPWAGLRNVRGLWCLLSRDLVPLTLETLAADGLPTSSREAWEMLRIEQGYPEFGVDFGEDNLPQELQRDAQAISFTKGCYLGQETVARLDAMGHVNQMLSGVRLPPEGLAPRGTPLLAAEKVAGKLTSVAWSPRLGAPLGLAMLRRGAASPGTHLNLASGGTGAVVQLPVG